MLVTFRFNAVFRNTAFNKSKKKLIMKNLKIKVVFLNLKIKVVFLLFVTLFSGSQGYASNIPNRLNTVLNNEFQFYACLPTEPACKDRDVTILKNAL